MSYGHWGFLCVSWFSYSENTSNPVCSLFCCRRQCGDILRERRVRQTESSSSEDCEKVREESDSLAYFSLSAQIGSDKMKSFSVIAGKKKSRQLKVLGSKKLKAWSGKSWHAACYELSYTGSAKDEVFHTHVHDFRDLDQGDKQKTLFYPVRSL